MTVDCDENGVIFVGTVTRDYPNGPTLIEGWEIVASKATLDADELVRLYPECEQTFATRDAKARRNGG